MPFFDHIGNRKIIILSTTTPGWTEEEIAVNNLCNQQAQRDITRAGFKSQVIEISTAKDMIKKLSKINPAKCVIVNWVEEIEGLKYGYHIAPEILERLGFIYTGNNSDTLVEGYDKIKTKMLLKRDNVSTPKYTIIDQDLKLKNWDTYPCIVKPANEHCSYGITHRSVVDNKTQLLKRAKSLITRFKQPLLVEEFIEGPEYFVSTWGYDNHAILPPVCQDYSYTADYHHQIYDYVAKWKTNTKTFELCRHRLLPKNKTVVPKDIYTEVPKALRSVGCNGYCRVDVRVRDGISYIIDINPNPDITPDSDFILAASQLGFNYGETLLKLCDLAMKNFNQNSLENEKVVSRQPTHIAPTFATVTA